MAAAAALAHELLSRARDEGGADAAWDLIFERLREVPAALARPEPRKMALLHQAAYWGHKAAVETLLDEFKADPLEPTADGTGNLAADVADGEGHPAVAGLLRARAAAATAAAVAAAAGAAGGAGAAGAAAAPAPAAADVALAHELLDRARDAGGEEGTWTEIVARLREQPLAVVRPEVRKYSLLHQAAFWGNRGAAELLMAEFKADPCAPTADADRLDAASVAESHGHKAIADWLRARASAAVAAAAGGGAGVGGGASSSSSSGAAPPAPAPAAGAAGAGAGAADDAAEAAAAAAASSPYDHASAEGNKVFAQAGKGAEAAVTVWLRLAPAAGGGAGAALAWRLYAPSEQRAIEGARAAGQSSAKVGSATLDLEASTEAGGPGGAKPRRVVSFKVLWEWDGGEGGKAAPDWKAYPAEAQWELEAAMCAKDASAEVTVAPGKKYVVDLVGFRQYSSKDAFRCRRVRRRGVALREPFPSQVRDVSSGSWLDLASAPKYWAKGLSPDKPARFDLPLDSPVCESIAAWMNSTIRMGHAMAYGQVPGHGGPTKGMELVRVEVVHSPALWRRYNCYKGQLKGQSKAIKDHDGTKYLAKNPMAMPKCEWLDADVGEAYFWHGSGRSADGSVDLIESIVSVGHEPSDENAEVMEVADGASSRFAKNTSMFGAGVYLADIASKANLYVPCPVCHQGAYFRDPCHCSVPEVEAAVPYRMLLCRAVMGRVYIEKKYKDARYKGEFNPARKLGADSVMGEATKGKLAFREYVVYNDSASYPEFIIHYRRRAAVVKPGGGPKKKAKKG